MQRRASRCERRNIPGVSPLLRSLAGAEALRRASGARVVWSTSRSTRSTLRTRWRRDLERFGPIRRGQPRAGVGGLWAAAPRLGLLRPRSLAPSLTSSCNSRVRSTPSASGWATRPSCAAGVDAAFHLGVDECQGRRRVQLRLKSLRAAEAGGTLTLALVLLPVEAGGRSSVPLWLVPLREAGDVRPLVESAARLLAAGRTAEGLLELPNRGRVEPAAPLTLVR